jgi:nucleotide-binding universal stress UspA family protein
MYQKILVAVDMSPLNVKIFNAGLSLAKACQAQMYLLHVLSMEEESTPLPIPPNLIDIYPTVGNDLTIETWRQQWEEFEQEGKESLQSFVNQASEIGITVESQQVLGSPGKTICEIAQQWQADLIVIGRRGRSGISEILLGSVSNYVMHHAHCCLLIVQH